MGLFAKKPKDGDDAAAKPRGSLVGDVPGESGGAPPPDSGGDDSGGKKKGGLFGGMGKKKEKPQKEAKADFAPKRKKSELVKVLDESVWESVNEDFKANRQFVISDGGETKYVGFLFDTVQVGGLAGKENRKDESKGSIIEAIRTGRIKTYIRTEMLFDNAFIIIPDPDTIDNMDEFNLFQGAKYVLCTITPDGSITTETEGGTDMEDDPEVTVDFAKIKRLIETNGDVRGLFPSGGAFRPKVHDDSPFDTMLSEAGMAPARGVNTFDDGADPDDDAEPLPDDMVDPDDDAEPLPESLPAPDDYSDLPDETGTAPAEQAPQPAQGSVPVYGQAPAPEPAPAPMPAAASQPVQPPPPPAPVTPDMSGMNFGQSPAQGVDEGGYDEYADITADVVRDFVTRRFYSDDLGLEVSTEAFDAQFLHGNSYLPFNEDRGPGWLNEYLSNIARDANTRMERLHSENLFRMRERYMRLIQEHCKNIAKALDITDDSTQYGRLRYAIEQTRDDNLASADQTVSAKREQLERSWRAELDHIGQAAAMQAQQEHINRYGRTHDADILRLETIEKDEIERDYNNSIRRLHEDRRREASKMLDLAISETLQEMSAIYLRVLRDEKREYVRLQNEMTRFIDDNRKDEKARIEALAEENRQTKRANEVRAEFTAKIQSMAAEFDMKKTMLQADIDGINREHDVELRRLEAEYQSRLATEKARGDELQEKLDDMMERFTKVDGEKNEEYRRRLAQVDAEKEDWNRQMDHIIETHRRSNLISMLLVISILIAAIGIGFMLGSIVNVRRTTKAEQDAVYAQQQAAGDVLPGANAIIPGLTVEFMSDGPVD